MVAETRCAATTDLSTPRAARNAFDQLDKHEVRERLAKEQGWLCAFCMRRVAPEATESDGPEPTMKIAHRTPIDVDSSLALTWNNLLGSCDGGQRSGGRYWTCDAARGAAALTVDPTREESVARLHYERRHARQGLFISSDDELLRNDVEQTLALNSGDLPQLREAARKAFQKACRRAHPRGPYGKPAWRAYFPKWLKGRGRKLPEMLGAVEDLIR